MEALGSNQIRMSSQFQRSHDGAHAIQPKGAKIHQKIQKDKTDKILRESKRNALEQKKKEEIPF